ncbi:unnamed protein product [Choristocarpus tenellus]
MGGGVLAAIVQALMFPMFVLLLGSTLDELGEPVPVGETPSIKDETERFVVLFAIVGGISLLMGFIMVSTWSIAGERQALRIRHAYVKAILRQDIGWFDEHPAGQLPTAVTANMAKVQDGMGRKVVDIILNSFGGIFLLATSMYINAELGAVMLACIPFIGGSVAILSKLMASNTVEGADHYAKAGGVATETLGGIRTVASLSSEKQEIERYASHLDGAYTAGIKEGLGKGLGNGCLFTAFYLSYALAFWFGTNQVADGDGDVSGGDVLSAIFAVLFAAMQFGQTAPGITALSAGRASAVHVFETIKRVPPIDSLSEEGLKPVEVEGQVTFKEVGFSYPARPNDVVYERVDLEVEVGKTLALVGPSGGGKSTMTKLLLRFYDPTKGQVLLDGVDIASLNVAWYRNQIGYVGQEPVLFNGSINDNIANGKVGASHEEVVAAAKAANAHTFIKASSCFSFPKGYNTSVGEGGLQLSGGQKQRIAIARAIIKDPAILLLDEATSALDSESEKVVQDALDNLQKVKSRTTVVIAHRLSTIQNADTIAVIADKGVAEKGTHEELLAINGIYAGLCAAQLSGENAQEEKDDYTLMREASTSGGFGNYDSNYDSVLILIKRQSSISQGGVGADKEESPVEKEEEKLPAPPMSRLWALNKGDWKWLLLGFVGAILAGGTFPTEGVIVAHVQSNLYKEDIDDMRREGNLWSISFVCLAVVAMVGQISLAAGFAVAGERLIQTLRNMAFKAMIRHDISWFDRDENATGVLTSRLQNDASKVRSATGTNLAHKTQLMVTLCLGTILGMAFAWQIGLLAVALIPLIASAGIIQMAMISGAYGDSEGLDGGSDAANLLSSSLTGVTTVTAFNMQPRLAKEYADASEGSLTVRRKRGFMGGVAYGFSQGVIFWAFSILFWFGSILVDDGTVEYRNFFTAMFAVMFGAFGVGQINMDVGEQGEGIQAAARIFALVDEPLVVDPLSIEGATPDKVTGALNFKNIKFAYPNRPDVQIYGSDKYPKGFNLSVNAGEAVALVGPSGSGKSTGMALLLRFYDPVEGCVELDGRDIREMNVTWLRSQIGYVGQEPVLFQGTVRENIAKGKPSASEDEIIAAAKASNAHNFVMEFKEGYDTDVGEKSALLSGGQKQRIAIARAILKDPPILLLDEATSALDNESEKQVQEALDNLQALKKRTTLTVAHRLTTIRDSDKIAVLNQGGVQEIGTHDELLLKKGLYATLWGQQMDKLQSSMRDAVK